MTKSALITGVSRTTGIGFHIARGLLSRGYHVTITVRSKSTSVEALTALQNSCEVHEVNLSDAASIRTFGKTFRVGHKTLDLLINNAGTLLDGEISLAQLSATMMHDTFMVNTIAPVLIFQEVLPLLQASSDPRVVNISSSAGQLGDGTLQAWAPAYSASKAALNAITQQMAAAYPNLAVNSVCPGWCSTGMGGSRAPLSPEQGADTPLWLATEVSQKISGKFFKGRTEVPW